MNSTYDYDPVSRKDELIDIVANVLNIVVPVIRPDITVMVGAFPWCSYFNCKFINEKTTLSSASSSDVAPWHGIQEEDGDCTRVFKGVPRTAV